jgi:hypothetical protein
MMARAPKYWPASRLIHNVDQSWNNTTKYMVTMVVGHKEEANRFLTNLIPELLYTPTAPKAGKWFSGQGLSIYQNVTYNPKKGTTSSTNAKASAAMVEEDLWDLSEKWKTLAVEVPAMTQCPDGKTLDGPKQPEANSRQVAGQPSLNKAKDDKDKAKAKAKASASLAGDKSFRAALARPPQEAIQPDSNAMEDEEHSFIHIGSNSSSSSLSLKPTTSSLSSSSSSSLSSSSDGTHNTQELIKKYGIIPRV